MRATDSPGSSAWIWFWALCGTLLPVVCLWYYAPKIEADLTTRVGAALTGVGVDPDRVFLRVDGRDVIFSGEVGEEMDPGKFVDTAAGIWGVRRVINQVEVFERVPSHLKMSLREGSVSLEGVLPDLQSVERGGAGRGRDFWPSQHRRSTDHRSAERGSRNGPMNFLISSRPWLWKMPLMWKSAKGAF